MTVIIIKGRSDDVFPSVKEEATINRKREPTVRKGRNNGKMMVLDVATIDMREVVVGVAVLQFEGGAECILKLRRAKE